MLRTCRFTLGFMTEVYDGFTDGSRWNGFLNVHVTRAIIEQIVEAMKSAGATERDEEVESLLDYAKDPALLQPGALVVLPGGRTGCIVHAYESGAFEIELSADRSSPVTVTLSEEQFEPLVSLAGGWATAEVPS